MVQPFLEQLFEVKNIEMALRNVRYKSRTASYFLGSMPCVEPREERRRGVWVIEAAIAETTALRRGYTMSAAWDEGAMIQAMSRMDNPTLRWRYGDVVDEEQGGEEAQHAREER